jgi:hypothetical protein
MSAAGIQAPVDARSIRMPTVDARAKWLMNMVQTGVRMVRDNREAWLAGGRMPERTSLRRS